MEEKKSVSYFYWIVQPNKCPNAERVSQRYFLLASTLGPPKGFFLVTTLCVWDKGTAHAQGNCQKLKRCGYPCLPTCNQPDGIGFSERRPTTNSKNQLSSQIGLSWSIVRSNEADKDAIRGSFY